MEYDLIGTINKPTGVMIQSQYGEYPETIVFEGYHVNMINADMELVKDYIVEVSTPSRTFAGRDDGICLKFKNREEWLSLGIEKIEEDIL